MKAGAQSDGRAAREARAQSNAERQRERIGDPVAMSRASRPRTPTASEQLEALLGEPWPFPGRPPKHDLSTSTVTDDWPKHVPVADAKVDVFEAWFGDLFDELIGPCR